MQRHLSRRPCQGFTLAEVIVSSALIVVVMGFLLVTVDQTRRTITSTTSRANQFQAARVAFDAMTRNLSQATLQTYWDLDVDVNGNPINYRRQADLHFWNGYAHDLLSSRGSASVYPTHAVFFQAPIGYTAEIATINSITDKRYRALTNLLSVVGYYIEWGKDVSLPAFVTQNNIVQDRYRYRLMEVIQPAEQMMVYNNSNYTTFPGITANPAQTLTEPLDWARVALGLKAAPRVEMKNHSRVLAENIVALILLPKVSERDRKVQDRLNDLTSDYRYDTRPKKAYDVQTRRFTRANFNTFTAIEKIQVHQLPPIVQVTIVAIDEDSAAKLQSYSTTPPDWTVNMFKTVTTEAAFLKELGDPIQPDPNSLVYKLSNPDRSLPTPRMNYRIFTTDVVLRGAKWSREKQTTP